MGLHSRRDSTDRACAMIALGVVVLGCTRTDRGAPRDPAGPEPSGEDARTVDVDMARGGADSASQDGLTADAERSAPGADTAPTDTAAATDAVTSEACRNVQAKICDDFESYTPGAPPRNGWSTVLSDARLRVDATRAFSGKQAVHISVTSGAPAYRSAYMSKSGTFLLPLPENVIHGRMMVYLADAPQGVVHWSHVAASGTIPGTDWHAIYRFGGQFGALMNNYYKVDPRREEFECWRRAPSLPMPTGKWVCFAWEFDGRTNASRATIDGRPAEALAVVDRGEGCVDLQRRIYGLDLPWTAPTFTKIELGWQHYQESPIPVEFWIDDVAVGAQPIACPSR